MSIARNIDNPNTFSHRFANLNGIRVHYVEEGQGPLVILLHGFPYLWYWWRHQIQALAAAGYRVIAPDMRGFGQTDIPEAIDAYNITLSVGDVVGIMTVAGEESAVVVGHDMGVGPAYYGALFRPDLFRGVVLLNSLPSPRGPARPSDGWKALGSEGKVFYQQYIQEPGRADRELAADTRKSLRSAFYSVSGSARGADRWRLFLGKGQTFLDTITEPSEFPGWLSDEALDYYVSEYTRTGWTGPLNQYRVRDRNWELTSFTDGALVRQPSLFIGGADDPALPLFESAYDQLETYMPGLQKKAMLPNVGHSAAEEQPEAVSRLLLEFLGGKGG